MKTLLKSATIIDSSGTYNNQTKDILIVDGIITKIEDTITEEGATVVELPNLHVSNGWFDSSVSFGEPGYEECETLENGTYTAAKSGFTSILLNPKTKPVTDNKSAISYVISKTQDTGVNVHPIGALTMKSESVDLAELYDMASGGAVAFGDFKTPLENPNLLKIALLYAQNFDALIMSFPNEKLIAGKGVMNEHIASTRLGLKGIPALAESLHVARDLYILEYTGGKLHIPTISTTASVELIKAAKEKGLDVTCSVAIHNLFFTDDALEEFDTRFKVMPPLRTQSDVDTLKAAVAEGIIDYVTTDHTPIDIENKKLEFDLAEYGTIGLESAFGALNKLFGAQKAVELLTKGKDRFNVDNSHIKVSEKAQLTLFNPIKEYTFSKEHILSSSKNSAFLNSKLLGEVYGIYNNSKLIIE
ncbi:dihydroorotase [Neptunitalea lumnitzerae]|uniref:Dihydroorotase n=1 Tax=Neptunitalea lumnitzerae TaxID=2965509 RepID=A0ABQ5MKX4_9FLAO|nr:dihydroorotase [Neptunitalea sp. Y10]GLB49715.1 dihydroorotase [Neptunitalea sp. Y10]